MKWSFYISIKSFYIFTYYCQVSLIYVYTLPIILYNTTCQNNKKIKKIKYLVLGFFRFWIMHSLPLQFTCVAARRGDSSTTWWPATRSSSGPSTTRRSRYLVEHKNIWRMRKNICRSSSNSASPCSRSWTWWEILLLY